MMFFHNCHYATEFARPEAVVAFEFHRIQPEFRPFCLALNVDTWRFLPVAREKRRTDTVRFAEQLASRSDDCAIVRERRSKQEIRLTPRFSHGALIIALRAVSCDRYLRGVQIRLVRPLPYQRGWLGM